MEISFVLIKMLQNELNFTVHLKVFLTNIEHIKYEYNLCAKDVHAIVTKIYVK